MFFFCLNIVITLLNHVDYFGVLMQFNMCLYLFCVFVFGIVKVLLCALIIYFLSASLKMLNSFVINLVIQNVRKKRRAGPPTCR
jgi:hypothetical protein